VARRRTTGDEELGGDGGREGGENIIYYTRDFSN
jgi:hypothetical protein